MHGRYPIPSESTPSLAHDISVQDRTIRAQVKNVDYENGFVKLDYIDMPAGGKYATVAPLWISFPKGKGPAWGRFMPQESDIVKVSFDHNGQLHIVGFDVVAQKPNVSNGLTGWPQLHDLYKVVDRNDQNPDRGRFALFTPLKPGEYDFMSTGEAYIYGNNIGTLYLGGGPNVSISLIKTKDLTESKSKLITHDAQASKLRFGQVRRNQGSGTETNVDNDGKYSEFSAYIKSGTTTENVALMSVGNVVGDTGTIIQSTTSHAVRYLYKAYDVGNLKYEETVDTNGDWAIAATAGSVNWDFSSGNYDTRFTNVTHYVSGSYIIDCNDIKLGGSTASQQLVMGNTYRSAEAFMNSNLMTQLGIINTQLASVVIALNTIAASMLIPVTGPVAAAPQFTVLSGLIGGISVNISNMISSISQFESGSSNYLSTVSRTK